MISEMNKSWNSDYKVKIASHEGFIKYIKVNTHIDIHKYI